MNQIKLLFVFGTRPEAIKMIPLIKEFKKHPEKFIVHLCVTGQHREMLDQMLSIFEVKADFDLNIMKKNQDLFDITSEVLIQLKAILQQENPDYVFVHGDTTSSMATALAAFYTKIPVVHVEAGLRTNDLQNPWPEEMNRQVLSRLSNIHFAPTIQAKQNLLVENIAEKQVFVTGNTVIDSLKMAIYTIEENESMKLELLQSIQSNGYDLRRLDGQKKMILITGHRRENFGEKFEQICLAIHALAEQFPYVDFVYPVHLNPNVQEPVYKLLKNTVTNIFLIPPLEYFSFVLLMQKSYLILTDSGGIQEEAPSLNKPVLVMRDFSERPEAIEAGTAKIVGSEMECIVREVSLLLDDENAYKRMSNAENPFGDGFASEKIVQFMSNLHS